MYIVMTTNESSTKIVNFINPGTGVRVLGHCHTSHVKCFILYSINIHPFLLYQGIIMLLSYPIVDFYAPEIEDRGTYCFCPVCHSVLLSESLTLLITFEQQVLEL